MKIGINGFGRIGRISLRSALLNHENVSISQINDLSDLEYIIYKLKYDSTHGKFPLDAHISDDRRLVINGKKIKISSERDPDNIKWEDTDVVIESTGAFLTSPLAQKHINGGAKKVIMSAPAKDDTPTFVMGVNHKELRHDNYIMSNASCTTNCLAPIAKVLNDNWTIEEGLMTTVHAATASQKVVDSTSKRDWRGGRGAYQNIIPTSTGAAKALWLVIPELKGKLTGVSFRVPLANVSAVDLTIRLQKSTSYEEIKKHMYKASQNELKGILGYTEDEVVSSDFISDPRTSIFDAKAGVGLNNNFFKIIAWYDNEYGYASKLVDLAKYAMSI
ncbi:MAG: type I glyceraldehyde-3-phosphate dehydrogenase [Solitalea-like symbiont of Tyrophagus putrescentiae]